ncbi:unnamed protein product, partial [Oppiella nova]
MTIRQLKLNANLKHIDLTEGQQFKPEFFKSFAYRSLLSNNGLVIWESRAIIQYLCNHYTTDSGLYPICAKKRAFVDFYINIDFGLGTTIDKFLFCKFEKCVDTPPDEMTKFKEVLQVLDQLIGDKAYLTGNELTIADRSLLATTVYIKWCEIIDFNDFPNLQRWDSWLMSELPYYKEINDIPREN